MNIGFSNNSGVNIDVEPIISLATFMLSDLRVHPDAELSVLIADEETMSDLHLAWMQLEGPTDVLSFPMDEVRPGSWSGGMDEDPPILGDLVLCPSVAAEQAMAAGHSATEEMHLLAAHGLLHLLGFDHAEPEEEREMFTLQADLLARWRISR